MNRLWWMLLLPGLLAGCGEPAAVETVPETAPAETEPTETLDPNDRKNAKDNLPADFNMNGETVGVLTRHTYRQIDWDGGDAVVYTDLSPAVSYCTERVQERNCLTPDEPYMEAPGL